jgi:hypothetical protein
MIDTFIMLARKRTVQAATAAALPAYTTTGVVITASANGALAAQDGITLTASERLLVQHGAAGIDDGVYTVTQVGTAGTPYILTRADDFAVGDTVSGALIFCDAGTVNGQQVHVVTNVVGSDVVGTDAITFATMISLGLSSTAALATVETGAESAGTALFASREDHEHDHGLLADGGAHYHDSDEMENMSGVAGADVTAALDALAAAILAAIAGLDVKPSVKCSSTAAIAAYTRTGNQIVGDAVGALGPQDTIATNDGDLYLLQHGASGIDNGIYVITEAGDGATAFVLDRVPEMLGGADAAGAFCQIEQGATMGDYFAVCTNNIGAAVVNTDALTWSIITITGLGAATPADIAAGGGGATGTATRASREDHVHAHALLSNGASDYHETAPATITTPTRQKICRHIRRRLST